MTAWTSPALDPFGKTSFSGSHCPPAARWGPSLNLHPFPMRHSIWQLVTLRPREGMSLAQGPIASQGPNLNPHLCVARLTPPQSLGFRRLLGFPVALFLQAPPPRCAPVVGHTLTSLFIRSPGTGFIQSTSMRPLGLPPRSARSCLFASYSGLTKCLWGGLGRLSAR